MIKIILTSLLIYSSSLSAQISIEKYRKFFSCPFEIVHTKDSIFISNVCKKYFSANINKFDSQKYFGIDGDSVLVKTTLSLGKKTNKGSVSCITFGNSFLDFEANGYLVETFEVKNYKLNGKYKTYELSNEKLNQKCDFEGNYKKGKLHGYGFQYGPKYGIDTIYSKKLYRRGKLKKVIYHEEEKTNQLQSTSSQFPLAQVYFNTIGWRKFLTCASSLHLPSFSLSSRCSPC